MAGWGKPKFTSGGKCPTWSLELGDNVYRILPPLHSLAEKEQWSLYATQHWGYAGSNPADPTKTKSKPFRCIEDKNRKTGMIITACPECELRAQYEEQEKAREAQLRAEGKNDEQVEAELAPIRGWLKDHNADRKHYLAVMNEKREFGHLKISHTTKKKLDLKIKELREGEGIEPLDLASGVWFNFKRISKNGLDDLVDWKTIKVEVELNGKLVKLPQVVLAPLTDEEADKALEEIRDLVDVGGYALTAEQILLLTQSSGDPDEVDQIFSMNNRERSAKRPAPVASKPAPVAATKPAPSPAASKPPIDMNDPVVKARIAKIQADAKAKADEEARAKALAEENRLAQAQLAQTQAEGSPTGAANPYEMNDEDFLKLVDEASQKTA